MLVKCSSRSGKLENSTDFAKIFFPKKKNSMKFRTVIMLPISNGFFFFFWYLELLQRHMPETYFPFTPGVSVTG